MRELISACRALPAGARAAYLDEACAGDDDLRREVESLLAYASPPSAFLESPLRSGELVTVEPAATSPVPERIGRYRVISTLGQGGMGVVYLAEQTTPVHRRVAVKVIKLGMDTHTLIARFQAERQTLAMMSHPGIAAILDAGATEAGRPFFVMELVEGPTITQYCDANDLGLDRRIELFLQACNAVQHAHRRGVIHRDLKPSNVIVADREGAPTVKVIDFGIAKAIDMTDSPMTLTGDQQILGTPAYMSPEQLDGRAAIDTRTDVYALGVVLYELLTGAVPFDPDSTGGLGEMQRLLRDVPPTRPSTKVREASARPAAERAKLSRKLRGDLDWIVIKALEKEPSRRYETASLLADDLQRHLRDEPVAAGPPGTVYRLGKLARRHKGAIAAGGAVLALVIGFAVSMSIAAERNRRLAGRERALREQADRALMVSRVEQARLHARTGGVGNAEELAWLPHLQGVDDGFTRWGLREVYARQPIVATIDLQSASSMLVQGCAVSPDGTLLATVGSNPAIRLFDGRSLRRVGTMPGHETEVRIVCFAPNGTRAASADVGGSIAIWDVARRRPVRWIAAHRGVIRTLAFSSDGGRLFSGGDDGRVLQWDVDRGAPAGVVEERAEPVTDVALSADGATLMVGSPSAIRIRDAADGRVLLEIGLAGSRRQALSPDGRTVASAAGREIRIWNASTGALERTLSPNDSGFRSLSWSPDGRLLVACGAAMHVYEAATYDLVHIGGGSWGQPGWGGGSELLYVPRGFGVRVWEMRDERGVRRLPGADTPSIVAASRSGSLAAAGGTDGSVRIWGVPELDLRRVIDAHAGPIGAVRFAEGAPDQLVTAGADGFVRCWSATAGHMVAEMEANVVVAASSEPTLDLSPDGRFAVAIERGGDGVILDLHAQTAIATLRHGRRLRGVAWSPAGDLIATTGDDRSMRLWTPDGEPVATIRHREGNRLHDQPFRSCAFDRSGRRLAGGVWGGTIFVFDTASRRHLATLKGHTRLVTAMDFSPDDSGTLASVSADGTLRLWNVPGQESLFTLELHDGDPVWSAGFGDAATIVAGGRHPVAVDLLHYDRHIAGNADWHLQRTNVVVDPARAEHIRRWAEAVRRRPWPRLGSAAPTLRRDADG